jgi:ribosomal protein L32
MGFYDETLFWNSEQKSENAFLVSRPFPTRRFSSSRNPERRARSASFFDMCDIPQISRVKAMGKSRMFGNLMTKCFSALKVSGPFDEVKSLTVTLRVCRSCHHRSIALTVLKVGALRFVMKYGKK